MAKRFPVAFSSPSIAFGGLFRFAVDGDDHLPRQLQGKTALAGLGMGRVGEQFELALPRDLEHVVRFVTSTTSSRFTSFSRSRTSAGYSFASEFKLSRPSGADKIADR